MIKSFRIFESNKGLESFTVYHGSNEEHDFSETGKHYQLGGTFFSEDKNEAKSHGKFLYEIQLKPTIDLFSTINLSDCEKLIKHCEILYDDYFDEDVDPDNYFIKTPEQLSNHTDNWNAIEKTPGVLDWLHHYDGAIITEGGCLNILIFDPVMEKIQSYKLL
jgi:hypothetical protein